MLIYANGISICGRDVERETSSDKRSNEIKLHATPTPLQDIDVRPLIVSLG